MAYMDARSSRPSKNKPPSYDGGYMAVGKHAENIVINWLTSQSWCQSLQDVRDDAQMRHDDVDVIVIPSDEPVSTELRLLIRNHDPLRVEIKSDKYLGVSNNMLFETYRIWHDSKPGQAMTLGWSARSTAHIIVWYAASVHSLYIIRLDDLQRAFQDYTRNARRGVKSRFIATDATKTTHNVYIPMEYVASKIHIVKLEASQ